MTSKFWAALWKKESNFLLVWIMVCIESCLPVGWRTFIWWKNPPKCCSMFVWIAGCWNSLLTTRNPKNNWCLSRIFGARFGGKDRSLSTCKPWSKKLFKAYPKMVALFKILLPHVVPFDLKSYTKKLYIHCKKLKKQERQLFKWNYQNFLQKIHSNSYTKKLYIHCEKIEEIRETIIQMELSEFLK
jgi:hypothetical protein